MEVQEGLAANLGKNPAWKSLDRATRRSFDQIDRRGWSRAQWRVGDPYDNEADLATGLSAPSLPMRTSFTLSATLRRLLAQLRAGLWGIVMTMVAGSLNSARFHSTGLGGLVVALAFGTVIALVVGGVQSVKVFKELKRSDHADLVLKDVGRTIVLTLRDLRLISVQTQPEDVLVVETPGLEYQVSLARASREDAELFVTCMSQALAPISNQRYLVGRDVSALPQVWLRPLWVALRHLAGGDSGVTFHPVPDMLGARKDEATTYHYHWNRNVGRGELIYTKTPAGFEALLTIREKQQPETRSTIFDMWH